LRPFGRKRRKSHPALRCHGADVVHCISILREVTASAKRLLQRQQRRRPEKQRLCLVPHTMPFSWTAIRWVVEPRVYSAAVFASVRLWEHNVGKVPRKPLFVAYVLCLTQSFDSGGISISFGVISFWRTAASGPKPGPIPQEPSCPPAQSSALPAGGIPRRALDTRPGYAWLSPPKSHQKLKTPCSEPDSTPPVKQF
jgi:hypothetical protein